MLRELKRLKKKKHSEENNTKENKEEICGGQRYSRR